MGSQLKEVQKVLIDRCYFLRCKDRRYLRLAMKFICMWFVKHGSFQKDSTFTSTFDKKVPKQCFCGNKSLKTGQTHLCNILSNSKNGVPLKVENLFPSKWAVCNIRVYSSFLSICLFLYISLYLVGILDCRLYDEKKKKLLLVRFFCRHKIFCWVLLLCA